MLLSPGYSSHIEQTLLMEATPVYVQLTLDDGWQVRAQQVEEAVSPKTKALVLNYPANPTGAVFDPVELQKIAELAVRGTFS